ncbi:MAG TPA: hypothetical protein VFL59_16880 [Candidatus Nanopelagicales bacterium]|nr:hypothetical protein [Candidatus Nanopelagicales bacterium]
MRRSLLAVCTALALGLAVAAAPAASASAPAEATEIQQLHARGSASPRGGASTPITYHGGAVMADAGGVHAYVVWYGGWDNGATTVVSKGSTLLADELAHIGGSPYFNINTTYTNGSGGYVHNAVTLAGQTTDYGYSLGKRLTDANIRTIVSNAISSGRLPKDTNGVYFVLTAKDVSETSGFLTKYCGWHTHATIGGSDIKYAFVGDPSTKLANCSAQSVGPNGSAYAGADAMASVVAHELEEAASDPDLNAWYDGSGAENADKCAWTFGATSIAANGAKYNVTWGTTQYLVQQNWVAGATQGCAMSY